MNYILRVLAFAAALSANAAWAADNPCAGKPTQAEFRSCISLRQAALIAAERAKLGLPDPPPTLGPTGAPEEAAPAASTQ